LQGFDSADRTRGAILLLHGRRIDNRFGFHDHNQTFSAPEDDTHRQRINAEFSEWGGYLGGRWEGDRFRGVFSTGLFRRTGGRPGPLAYESPRARLDLRHLDGRFSLETTQELFRFDLSARRIKETLHDDWREVGFDPAGTVRSVSRDLSGRLSFSQELIREKAGLRIQAGTSWRRQWFVESLNGEREPERIRTTLTGYATLQFDLFGPRLALLPSWRWLQAEDNFPALPTLPYLPEVPLVEPHVMAVSSPGGSLIWETVPGLIFLEAHAARTVRLPTWVELFGHRGGIEGNRELQPEELTTFDLAVRLLTANRSFQGRVAFFKTRIEETIIFVQNSLRTSRAQNFGITETTGVEGEVFIRLGAQSRLGANLTIQDARDRGDHPSYQGKRIPFLPALEGTIHLHHDSGPWKFTGTMVFESDNYRDRYNTEPEHAPDRVVWNLGLGRRWAGGVFFGNFVATLTAELINLTNSDVYDVEGFPLPGRTVRLSFHLR
jgi:outer membrane receptor protein involved in Fe transport